MGSFAKDYQMFRLRTKNVEEIPATVFRMTTAQISGLSVPSGIMIFDTTLNKLKIGIGGTTLETVTSS